MPKRVLSSLFATAFAAAALVTSPGVRAQKFMSEEQNLFMQSYADTPEGCLIVDVFLTSVTTKPPTPVVGFTSLHIVRSSANCATHLAEGGFIDVIATGSTEENPTEFTLDQRLRKGTLKTTMGVFFWQIGEERPLAIDLVFSGIEDTLSPIRSFNHFPGSQVVWHDRGYLREATASGSISDGTTDYLANPYVVKATLRFIHTQRSGPKPRMFH